MIGVLGGEGKKIIIKCKNCDCSICLIFLLMNRTALYPVLSYSEYCTASSQTDSAFGPMPFLFPHYITRMGLEYTEAAPTNTNHGKQTNSDSHFIQTLPFIYTLIFIVQSHFLSRQVPTLCLIHIKPSPKQIQFEKLLVTWLVWGTVIYS